MVLHHYLGKNKPMIKNVVQDISQRRLGDGVVGGRVPGLLIHSLFLFRLGQNLTHMASIPATPAGPNAHDSVEYLRSLPAIRARCTRVHELATKGRLIYFDYHPEKEDEVVDFCKRVIEVRIAATLALGIILSRPPNRRGDILVLTRYDFHGRFSHLF
jgi:hypothetical protein